MKTYTYTLELDEEKMGIALNRGDYTIKLGNIVVKSLTDVTEEYALGYIDSFIEQVTKRLRGYFYVDWKWK